MEQNERDLLERARKNDTEAWEEIHKLYNEKLYGYVYRRNFYNHNLFNPEDVVSETWIRVFQSIGSYNPDKGEFYSWLLTIARRVLFKEIKEQKKIVYMGELDLATIAETMSVIDNVVEEDSVTKPVEVEELRLIALDAVRSLSKLYREPFTLHYIEGHTHTEIAKFLEISVANSRVKVHRAMVQVKEYVRERLQDEMGVQ